MRSTRITVLALILVGSACSVSAESSGGVVEPVAETTVAPVEVTLLEATTDPPPTDLVAAPVGVLGPRTVDATDPETVGIEWVGDRYEVPEDFVWDEAVTGSHLLFDRGRVLIAGDGVSISGAVIDAIDSGNNSVIAAGAGVGAFTLTHFTVLGGSGSAAVGGSIQRGNGSTIANFSIVDFDGDGVKPPIEATVSDGFIHLVQQPGSELHYDGVQITGRSGVTLARLRIRLEGDDNLNAAIFVHDGVDGATTFDTTIHDIDIEYAPATWYPLRLMSGTVTVRDIVGRGPVSADGRRPSALIRHLGQGGIDWSSVHPLFDGEVPAGSQPR